jgi:hypothetical protein
MCKKKKLPKNGPKCDCVANNAQEKMGCNAFWWKIVHDGWSSSLSNPHVEYKYK